MDYDYEHHNDRSVFVIAYLFIGLCGAVTGFLIGLCAGWMMWG